MNKTEITNRWRSIQIKKIIKKKRIISPFGNFENKEDLRGISFSQEEVKHFQFINTDFSLSSFENSWIENTEFKSCIFYKVDFSEFSDHSNIFIDCSFVHCKFNKSAIGYQGSKYQNCIFNDCNFTRSLYIRPEFKYCEFRNCKINNIDFNSSSFEYCVFEGNLNSTWFRGGFPLSSDEETFGKPRKNIMKNVSFLKATLSNITYSDNCDLSTVLVDENKGYYKFDNWLNRLKHLQANINQFEGDKKREIETFVNSYLVHAKKQEWYIISIDDLIEDYGKVEGNKILEILNNYS